MTRRAFPLLSHWACRVFAVELDGAPFYFQIQEQNRAAEVPRVFSGVHRCYSVLVCGSDRVRRARFHGELRDRLLRDLPPECDLSPMCSYLPDVRDSVVKGYFVKDHSVGPSSTERLLSDLLQRDPVMVCSYLRAEDGPVWTQHPWSSGDRKEEQGFYYVVPSHEPEEHPSLHSIYNSDVFYSFEEAHKVLKEVQLRQM